MKKRNWIKDLKDSNALFTKIIWPAIADDLGGGKLLAIEGVKSEIADTLDKTCGIDYLQLLPDGATRGIASRVQTGQCWDSFTVRLARDTGAKTEYLKRREAIKNEYIYPALTIQSYVIEGLISVGVIFTVDLWSYMSERRADGYQLERRTANTDGKRTDFVVVDWAKLKEAKKRIQTFSISKEEEKEWAISISLLTTNLNNTYKDGLFTTTKS